MIGRAPTRRRAWSVATPRSDLTNAECEPITLNPGAVIMDLATSLGAMRNGYIATAILGGTFIVLSVVMAAYAGASREPAKIDTSLAGKLAPIQQQQQQQSQPAPVQPAPAQKTAPQPNQNAPAVPLAQ